VGVSCKEGKSFAAIGNREEKRSGIGRQIHTYRKGKKGETKGGDFPYFLNSFSKFNHQCREKTNNSTHI